MAFFFNEPATTEIYTDGHTLSLHDALPISPIHAEDRSRSSARTRPQRSWPMPPMTTTSPFLITGVGRSGTGWAAALFTALGYPCGHETVFGVNGPGAFNQPDSSWLAVPYAAQTPLGTPLLRIMRDPRQVVMSALAKGFLADLDDPFARYVRSYRPSITRPQDHLTRVIRYVALWDDHLDDLGHTVLKRSEEHTSELQSLMRISYAVFCLKKKKTKRKQQPK